MKIAFGENPKNCYKSRGIYSRMTIAAKLREVLRQAELYEKDRKRQDIRIIRTIAKCRNIMRN